MQETVIKLEHITREFPGVLANDDVSLEIHRGEVFALVGENGAGKSTLMNIIYGIFPPTDGSVYIRGKKVETFSPKNAIDMGIGMVHQHFMLVPSFTVAQNIVMSREPRRAGLFFDNRRAEEITRELVREYGLNVDPSAQVQDISVGVQQRVEILKALYRGADILILDEPTAVLTPQETAELFRVIRHIIKEKNMTVILITHKLGEVMAISDRVGIMRQGKLVGLSDTKDITEKEIASMMVGRPVLFDKLEKTGVPGETMISVENLSVRDNRGLVSVRGVSLEARAGEVLGIAAIEGNGQSELIEAITGLRRVEKGSVIVNGKDVTNLSPRKVRQAGLAHIPEDRNRMGLNRSLSIVDNLVAVRLDEAPFTKGKILDKKAQDEYAEDMVKQFDIRPTDYNLPTSSLSGGNAQKVVVAREVSMKKKLLVASQPTRGVDIGAIELIRNTLEKAKKEGAGVLLVSAELEEIISLSDRIVVIHEGKITGEMMASEANENNLGLLMMGGEQKRKESEAAV